MGEGCLYIVGGHLACGAVNASVKMDLDSSFGFCQTFCHVSPSASGKMEESTSRFNNFKVQIPTIFGRFKCAGGMKKIGMTVDLTCLFAHRRMN